MTDTKERILDTAERAFAEHGFDATSLRSIIAEAGVNLAAVHYHFGTKEKLLEAVLMRRFEPVNRERLAMLETCELAATGSPPQLEGVLRAFVEPMLRVSQQPGGDRFVRLVGRIYAETDLLPGLFQSRARPVIDVFYRALCRALPELDSQELLWRAYFAIGATAHALRGFGGTGLIPLHSDDIEATLARLIPFLAAGFRAPAPCPQEK
jgi:AcrR family transcriptional regulator